MEYLRENHPGYPRLECSHINSDERFTTNEDKRNYMRKVHVQKGWCCPTSGCGWIFTSSKQLNKHRNEEHPDLTFLPCLLRGCETLFTSEDGLQTHFREAHADRVISCRIGNCPKVFLTGSSEKAHHSGDRCEETFGCLVVGCGKVFDAERKLQKHMVY
jgi:hypothetical protein